MVELLPCPFCGGEADTYDYEAERNIYDPITLGYVDTETYTKYGVGCTVCGAMVAEQMSIEKAINLWNTRTPKERGDKMSDTKTLIVQFSTAEQYNEVRKMAHKHEMNISQFIRYLIDKEKQDMRKEDEGK